MVLELLFWGFLGVSEVGVCVWVKCFSLWVCLFGGLMVVVVPFVCDGRLGCVFGCLCGVYGV